MLASFSGKYHSLQLHHITFPLLLYRDYSHIYQFALSGFFFFLGHPCPYTSRPWYPPKGCFPWSLLCSLPSTWILSSVYPTYLSCSHYVIYLVVIFYYNKYLLMFPQVPSTIVGTKDTVVNKNNFSPYRTYILGKMDSKQRLNYLMHVSYSS